MHHHHLQVLVCPSCSGGYRLTSAREDSGYVIDGELRCSGCNRRVPIRGSIPRFSDEAYASNFGKQWKRFREVERVHGTDTMQYYASGLGLVPSDVTGKRVLEVGCGSGRGVQHFLSGSPSLLVAVDMSAAVEVVEERFGERPELLVLQCDLRTLPLRLQDFDVVYSYGVIHHTPEPPKSFAAISRHVAPGGRLAVWVYGPGVVYGAVSEFVRRRAERIPYRLLSAFCWSMAALAYTLHQQSRIPVIRRLHGRTLSATRRSFRVLPTGNLRLGYLWAHDYHTTKYMNEYEPRDLSAWFASAGFSDMRALRRCGMIATKIVSTADRPLEAAG